MTESAPPHRTAFEANPSSGVDTETGAGPAAAVGPTGDAEKSAEKGTEKGLADTGLSQLGRSTPLPASPEDAVLETFPNPHPDSAYLVRMTCPEFTCLCPITGQPDFAHIVIDIVPDRFCVESKSLKLFLASWRNAGAFHESTTVTIAKRLIAVLAPRWLRVSGFWYPRGGIPIDVLYQTGTPPDGLFIPDPGVSPYRGRA